LSLFRQILNNFAGPKTKCTLICYTDMITVSDTAKKEVLRLMDEDQVPTGSFIRVGVKGGGCSGLTYEMDFDSELKEDDKVFEDKGIRIAVDKKSFLYLIGTELEYTGGLNGTGFVFNNPNASRTCGCGESFSI
jgi:iron-sulfur cluster assembly protein